MPDDEKRLTELLHRWNAGDRSAADDLLRGTYDQLRLTARGMMRGERTNHTLQATALVHEAFLRVSRGGPIDEPSRDAFFRIMVAQMRRHLIDHARRRTANKRGSGAVNVGLTDLAVFSSE